MKRSSKSWHSVLRLTGEELMQEWVNWSGSLRFTPAQIVRPRDEEALAEIIRDCYNTGKKVRLAAAGHSSSPLVQTDDVVINLKHFTGIVRQNEDTATLRAGMTVQEVNIALQKSGCAIFNTGDVDVQTLAGAICTATHGSGKKLPNLATILAGTRIINYKGETIEFSEQTNPEAMRALRVSLGALGIMTELTVKTVPLFELRRMEICTDTETCLSHFPELALTNRNVDFYWYPRRDDVKIRILNEPGKGSQRFDFEHVRVGEEVGFVGNILPKQRELKFDEMEYALAEEAGPSCFREIRKRVMARHRGKVAWRILYRCVAKDDSFLSPHYNRDSIAISLHHNAGLPFDEYFNDIEPIFRNYGGRPHWAKKHNMTALDLPKLYPEWNAFQRIRKSLDPTEFYLNDYLKKILIQNA